MDNLLTLIFELCQDEIATLQAISQQVEHVSSDQLTHDQLEKFKSLHTTLMDRSKINFDYIEECEHSKQGNFFDD